jgi:hypothetical protein
MVLHRMVASAVIIPDVPEVAIESPTTHTSTLKRRHTDASEPDPSKRLRLSPDANEDLTSNTNGHNHVPQDSSVANESLPKRGPRKPAGRDEERKRGQRMFGALLGALSASGSSTRRGAGVQKKRMDIEKRTQAKLQQIHVEDEKNKQNQVERILRQRRREHWVFEEQAVSLRTLSLVFFMRVHGSVPAGQSRKVKHAGENMPDRAREEGLIRRVSVDENSA